MKRLAILLLLALIPVAAHAGPGADLARKALESGRLAEGEGALTQRLAADRGDDEARFGLAMVRFAAAIERFGQAGYRHGLQAPYVPDMPFMRLPVPLNPKPEQLTYETQRQVLQRLLDDLTQVEETLAGMGAAEVAIRLDLNAVTLDLNGDGKADPSERLSAILAALAALSGDAKAADAPPFEVKFDRADAFWLSGYCHLLSAALDFILAYDWRETFDDTAILFYAGAVPRPFPPLDPKDPAQLAWARGLAMERQIANAVAFVHAIRWPLAEPERLKRARQHLLTVIAMSRATWRAILAETDDDHEWIPSPRQKHGVLGLAVTQERVDAWLAALDQFEAALEGRKLVPHWAFYRGFNLKRVFEEPRPFDLVLWATGFAAVPYIEDGPVISSEVWRDWERVFAGNFLAYAFWFN